jgi:hypothetical protein
MCFLRGTSNRAKIWHAQISVTKLVMNLGNLTEVMNLDHFRKVANAECQAKLRKADYGKKRAFCLVIFATTP